MFVKVNWGVIRTCETNDDGSLINPVNGSQIATWLNHLLAAERFLVFQTAFKGCIGCVQMAQLMELGTKLRILLEVEDISILSLRKK